MLYLCLALFGLFISFFSVILFNYVGYDIKVARSIYLDTRMQYDIKSILTAVTEIYRERNMINPGDISLLQIRRFTYVNGNKRYDVEYRIQPINHTHLLVELYKGNRLWARGIVKWREHVGDISFVTAKNQEVFKPNSFYSSVAIFSNEVNIPPNSGKIFKRVIMDDTTIVNGRGSDSFQNIEEMKKYAEYIQIDRNVESIMRYYRELRDKFEEKIVNSMSGYGSVYSNAGNIVLTPYGAIWIRRIQNIPYIRIKFIEDNSNQVILFEDNNGDLICRYVLVQENQYRINLNINDEVITNDSSIRGLVGSRNERITIRINPVSKVLECPRLYTIFTNSYLNTIIYSEMPIIIGSDGPEDVNGAKINSKIMIITNQAVKVKNNIIYADFSSMQDFISRCEAKNLNLSLDRKSLLRVISNRIEFDTSEYRISNQNPNIQCLCGQFVAMYDNNSLLTVTNPSNISGIYIFGSIQFSNRGGFDNSSFRELYITDGMLVSIDPAVRSVIDGIDDNIFLNKISVLGVEISSR